MTRVADTMVDRGDGKDSVHRIVDAVDTMMEGPSFVEEEPGALDTVPSCCVVSYTMLGLDAFCHTLWFEKVCWGFQVTMLHCQRFILNV